MARRVVTDRFNATIGIAEICIGLSVLYIGTIFIANDKELIVPVLGGMYPTGITTLVLGVNNIRKSFRKKEPPTGLSEFYSLSNDNPYADIVNMDDRNPYRLDF